MCTEFYNYWGVHWGETGGAGIPGEFVDNLDYMYKSKNASVNMYMVCGGTNFEFYNGALWNAPVRIVFKDLHMFAYSKTYKIFSI